MPRRTLLLIFLLLSLFSRAQSPDLHLLKSMNQHEKPHWDKTMKHVSFSVFPMMPVTTIGIWAHGFATNDASRMRNGYKSALSLGFAALCSKGLKHLVKRPRPYARYPEEIVRRDRYAGAFSFPSGHTTSAFALATALTLSYPEWYVAVPSYLYASLVAYSRMRLGMHYPSDVLMGILIGVGSGFLTWQVDKMVNGVHFSTKL